MAHEAPADDGIRAHRLEQLVRGTEQFLHDVGYPRQTSVTRAVSDLRRVLGGTYLTQRDVNTVLGCYRHIRYQLRMAGVSPAPGDASPPLEAELGPERADTSPST